jgi:hypothetical protein
MKTFNQSWYSVIISVLLVWFLLIITTSVFHLVLKEFNDNKWLWDSIKAFAWAEASQELALLKIKDKWYGIDDKIEHTISTWSILLAEDTTNTWAFKQNKETFISYDLNVLADFNTTINEYEYSETLGSNWYSIIPLFYEKEGGVWIDFLRGYELNINGIRWELVWNLIAGQEWIGNHGAESLEYWNWKIIHLNGDWKFEAQHVNNQLINTFLSTRNNAYLILFNSGSDNIDFTLTSWDKFSKPKTTILSSAQVWKYRHNLETQYDNTQFLNMLKYAVFSE